MVCCRCALNGFDVTGLLEKARIETKRAVMGHKGHSTGNISGVGLARDVEEIGTHVDAGHEEVKGIGKNGHFRAWQWPSTAALRVATLSTQTTTLRPRKRWEKEKTADTRARSSHWWIRCSLGRLIEPRKARMGGGTSQPHM